MSFALIIIIILVISIACLIVFLVKNIFIPKRAATTENLLNKSMVLKAIRAGKEAVEKDPQSAEAHYNLGKAFLADKRDEQAFREFKSVSRLGIGGNNIPETEFRETIASLYTRYNETEEALKEYIMLIKLHPENPEYYFMAGKLFSSRNRGDLAEQYFRKAISINSKEKRYHIELGMNYYMAKRIKEANVVFDTVIKLDPQDGLAQLYMGKILKGAKDFAGSIPFLEKASRDQEYKLQALVELGSSYMSLRMMDKAIGELERAVNIIDKEADPDSLYARYFLAMCFEKTKEYTKAIAQWDKIYAVKKNFMDVGEKLTQYIEYRTGDEDPRSPKRP